MSEQVSAVLKNKKVASAVFTLTDSPIPAVDVISTGSLALDMALGIGGVPRGRLTEISGPEQTGKTGLCLHIGANTLKSGLAVCYIDGEQSFDADYAAACGIDLEHPNLLISQPDYLEQAFEVTEACARQGFGTVIFDSIVSLPPKRELEGETGESHPGLQARLITQALRRLLGVIKESDTAWVVVNQLRANLSGMGGFGAPQQKLGGGWALKYLRHVAIDLRRIKTEKDNERIRVRATVKKNKFAPPFRTAEYYVTFGRGIDQGADLVETAVAVGAITKRGAYFADKETGENIGQGLANAAAYVQENPEYAEKLREAILAA